MLGALSLARAHLSPERFSRVYAQFSLSAFAGACVATTFYEANGYVAAYAVATMVGAGFVTGVCRRQDVSRR